MYLIAMLIACSRFISLTQVSLELYRHAVHYIPLLIKINYIEVKHL